MLRLLLSLASVCLVAAVIQDGESADISSCPLSYYGRTYQEIFVTKTVDFIISFGQAFNNTLGSRDSVLVQGVGAKDFEFKIWTDSTLDWLTLEDDLASAEGKAGPRIPKVNATCALAFSYNTEYVLFVPYGDALLLITKNVQASDNAQLVYFVDNIAPKPFFVKNNQTGWLTGCRQVKAPPMSVFAPVVNITETCERRYCRPSGEVTESVCPPNHVCKQGTCTEWKKLTCAVVGNTIINSGGEARSIENFCPQTLLSNPHFSLGSFYENRRLTDVPFLVAIGFNTGYQSFPLTSDGKIVNSGPPSVLPENGTQIGNFTVTNVPGGVLVNFTQPDLIAEVFFDGTTAHIHYEGFEDDVFGDNLCTVNATAKGGPPGCDVVVSDPRGDGIDCDAVTQKCNALLREPFSDCSVDPQPYISACTNLLCNYTDTDGLFCHLLDAYARSCRLQDWMDSVGCSASECLNQHCPLQNEFCGLSVGGEPRCFCRASYAAPYRANGTLGKDTVCASKSASVSLVKCLLVEKGINISSLHLNDPSCTGVQDPKTNMVTFSFNDADHCAANVTVNGSRIIYSNTIMMSGNTGIITRDDQLSIEFSCAYAQPQVQTMSLKIMDSSVVKVIDAGEWTYVFNMTAFTDGTLDSAVDSNTELHLDQQLWVQAKATEVDEQLMALVINGCWATKENDANAAQKYFLIKNGCSDEESVEMVSNGEGLASVFSFNIFQFVGSDADVYLHCDTQLCLKSTGCTKTCV